MWLNVLTVLSFICFGFLLDVSSGNAESMDADLVKKINHVNDKLETMVSNYHELLKTVRDDGLKLDSLIKQNQTLNQRLNNTVDKMEKLVTNEQFLNLTIQALQTLTSEQQRAINEEKNMSKKLTSNYSDRLFNVNREVEFLKKQNRYLERTLNITVEKMEKLMSEKETSSYNIENLQNITSQQKHELKQVENKSKESTISIGFSLTLLNDELQELTNSTRIGFKNVNGKILKEKKLLRTEMQNFEKRIKQRINKKLEKIDPGCQQPLQAGSCSDYTVNYFFNTNSSKCERFWYGGCQGNQNNFKSDEECQAACVQVGAIDLQKITKDVIDLNTKVFNLESSTDKSLSNLTLISSKLEKTFKDVQELKPDVDGQWSSWIDTPSSVTCGVGCRLRYRECSNPYPQQGGKKCTGSRNKHVKCQQYDPCPVHGTWSVWSETTCSVTCGVGTSLRYRNCSNPHPQYGGNNCTGKSIDHVICTHTDKCPAQLVQPSIRIEPTFQTVNEFETAEFRCIATGRPTPTVEWRRGTGTMNPSAVISGGVLKIPAALRSDEAQYFCQAINVAGSTLDRTILYVKSNPRPLTLIVRQVAIIATIGNTEQLICYIDDNSVRPTLIWSRNGGLPSGSRQDNGVLTLNNIQSSHAGSYVCSGKTPNGAMGKATATLTVRPEIETTVPNASVTPDRTTISEGTNGTIRCNVTGTPQPKITWSKSRGELTERHQVFRETLIITNAQVEDRGVYICRAENTAGLGQDRAIVEVQRRVKLRLDIYPGISQTIMMGESALFRCRVMGGDPPPNATWSRAGGQPIVSTIDTTDNGVIKFKDVTGEESGVYICTVTNEMGSVTATATLRVIENTRKAEEYFNQAKTPVKYNLPVSLALRQQFNIKKSTNENLYIRNCIKTGNTLVFTDLINRRLIICNSDGTNIHHIPLSYQPWYITEIDSNTVAVSCAFDQTILIINISTRSVTSTINTSGVCSGISYNDNNLYVVIGGSIIHVMDLRGKVTRTIPLPSDDIWDITVDRDRVVCIETTSIYCCSLDGKKMWEFEKDKFEDLTRVTTDHEGNVYVTNESTHTVIVISDDGKHHRELLTESDGLDWPCGIYFDKKENTLLVCNYMDGKAFLFDVKKN